MMLKGFVFVFVFVWRILKAVKWCFCLYSTAQNVVFILYLPRKKFCCYIRMGEQIMRDHYQFLPQLALS